MPAHLFRLMEQRQATRSPQRGATPFFSNLPPTAGQSLLISGVTRDGSGVVLGACEVDLFDTDTDTLQGRTVSDATTGAFSFSAGMGRTYYLRAYKAGAPDVAGTTVNTIVVS